MMHRKSPHIELKKIDAQKDSKSSKALRRRKNREAIQAERQAKKELRESKAKDLKIKGSRSSYVDAFAMPFETVDANLSNSSSVTVSVSKIVYANLVGGSSLYFSGTPEFRIEKIVKSTLAPYGTK